MMQRTSIFMMGGLSFVTAISIALAHTPPETSNATSAGEANPQLQPKPAEAEINAEQPKGSVAMRPAIENPKPLSDQVKKGLEWLASHQLEDGGWGQGEESAHMGAGMNAMTAKSNVADTCISILAFIRAGGSPADGQWSTNMRRGLEFVFGQIEAADADSLSITSINGTRVQSKLGPFIDTFLASLVLVELKGKMPNEAEEQRLAAATRKVLHKIEKNQKNGVWENPGWAPVLAQSIAAKGMNRAGQAGIQIAETALAANAKAAADQVSDPGAGFGDAGSAGIALYSGAANLGTLQDSVNTNEGRRDELVKLAEAAPDEQTRVGYVNELKRIDGIKVACEQMHVNILQRLDDPQFIAGFGSNGGEEFISYMNIGEALVVKNDDSWKTWDAEITANMNRIQNNDGSWSGHHCITGRNFCTASALLVLMVDRTPVPVEAIKAAAVEKNANDDIAPQAAQQQSMLSE